MALFLVTDESNPDFDALVTMSASEADRVVEQGFQTLEIDSAQAISYAEFAADYLDED